MQNVVKQAYQAEVLLRKIQLQTVGTRYPHKDQFVLTAENIERHPENDLFSYTHRIDVVVKCENRIEAIKLNQAIKEYFAKDLMLPLEVGVFQKPFTKDNQKARKYFAHAMISAKDLLAQLPTLEKKKELKYSVGATPVESNTIVNGFDLTYAINAFTMEKTVYTIEDAKKQKREIEKDIYKLSLCTSSIFQDEDDEMSEELVNFEISCDTESEIIELATLFKKHIHNGIVFTCKGAFPRSQKDFYSIPLLKRGSELIEQFVKSEQKAS